MSDSEDEFELPDGVEPDPEDRIEISEWEERTDRELYEEDAEEIAKYVTWCFIKWDDLQYDQCECIAHPRSRSHVGHSATQKLVPVSSLFAWSTALPPCSKDRNPHFHRYAKQEA